MADIDGKLGIVGIGNWGWNHLSTQAEIAGEQNIIVADLEGDRLEEARKRFPDVETTGDVEALFERPEVGAVTIATPAPTHADLAPRALLAGKDVLVEKPITLSSDEGEKLTELADREDAILMVGHLLLYQQALDVIRNAIHNGAIGKIQSLHQVRRKLGTVRENENVLWSFGVHDLAVFLDLIGEPPGRVEAHGFAKHQESVEDDVHVDLEFPEDVHAHLHTSWIWPETERRLTVIGTDGVLRYDELQGQVTLFDQGIEEDLSTFERGQEILAEVDDEPLTREIEHFLDCISRRETPRSDGQNGVQVIEILEQADNQLEASSA